MFGGGGLATVSVPGGARDAAKVVAAARSLGLDARLPGGASQDLRLANPRFGDLVVLAPAGTAISELGPGLPCAAHTATLPTSPAWAPS